MEKSNPIPIKNILDAYEKAQSKTSDDNKCCKNCQLKTCNCQKED